MTHSSAAISLVLLLIATPSVAAEPPPVEVNTCAQVVTGQLGYLAANLDCTGTFNHSVILHDGSLDLRGFTLTGGLDDAVHCEGRCAVFSSLPGGTITGAERNGISAGYENTIYGSVVVSDLTISNVGSPGSFQPGAHDGDAGVYSWWLSSATLINVTITGVDGHAINSYGQKLLLENCQIVNNNSVGVHSRARSTKILGSTISGNGGTGVHAIKVSISDSTVQNNGGSDPYLHPGSNVYAGIESGAGKIRNTLITQNVGYGVYTRGKVSVRESDVTDNGVGLGAHDGGISIKDSTVSGHSSGVSADYSLFKSKGSTITDNDWYGVNMDEGKVLLSETDVTNNGIAGVRATGDSRVLAKESIILGNDTDPNCGVSETCADIWSSTRPIFEWVSGINECDLSYVAGSGVPGRQWGVCYFDCGNGILTGSEVCDDSGESAACDDDCTLPSCGDGNTNETDGEQCDDGANVSNDGCDATCIIEYCGDSITQSGIGEACDDGAENTATCDSDCTAPVCGDGLRNKFANEQCDDHNTNNNDGCSSTCQNE